MTQNFRSLKVRDIYYAEYHSKGGGGENDRALGGKNKEIKGAGEKNEKREIKREENYIKKGKKHKKCIFLGHKLQTFSREGLPTPPAVGRGSAPPAAYVFVQNYIKNGGKVLKIASFGVINSKN